MSTHAPYWIALFNFALGIGLLTMASVSHVWAWLAFFSGAILVAVSDGSVTPFISITALALILFVESRWPRARNPVREPVSRKLAYVFFKRATRPAITALVATIGLSVWSPPWGMKSLSWPVWQQALAVLFAVDFEKYWVHRAQHSFDVWWRFHKVHHVYRDLRTVSSGATHVGEFVFVQAILITGLAILIGADGKALLLGYAIPNGLIAGYWAHANVDVPRKKMPWWSYVVMTPNIHGLHHSENGHRSNFSEMFPAWDLLFGTFRCPIAHRQDLERIGVPGERPIGSFWREQFWETSTLEHAQDTLPSVNTQS